MAAEQREMQATQQQLADANIMVHDRNYCAHLLLPLNECRHNNHFMNWKCHHEKHAYELCLKKEYERMVAAGQRLKEEKK